MIEDPRKTANLKIATVEVAPHHHPTWRGKLRAGIVRRGIHIMCGASSEIPTAAAADIPLVSATLRLAWLRILRAFGVKNCVAASGLGHKFVCHIGDLAEFPYYHRRALAPELALCAAWLRDENNPVVYDVGANVGFFSTQLSQMLADRSPQVFAFEPVPTTFAKLVISVQKLNLGAFVNPVGAAVLDDLKPVRLRFSEQNSLFSQVVQRKRSDHTTERQAYAAGVTLDRFYSRVGALPALIKMDVEGSEAAVLHGAKDLLSRSDRPAIIFEFDPATILESGERRNCYDELLSSYILKYVDDIQGQKLPFGSTIGHLNEIRWICNLFAVPRIEGWSDRWASTLEHARRELAVRA